MNKELHRHDISDSAWEKIKPHTIGEKGTRGGNAKNTRQFINGVFWILRTGAPWRGLPAEYGQWEKCPSPILPLERQRNLGKYFDRTGR